ncbi:MAG: phosphatase PAP2 family protein [Clostridia bacterium]|nr:phosphatase PAP2 family protein [Clostridia bacterium]
MKEYRKSSLRTGILLLILFAVWTVLVQNVDVQNAGQTGTEVGLATLNIWFHDLTGVHMMLYTITDWLGLVPVIICLAFGVMGFAQMIQRKSPLKVDADLILLGVYYIVVIAGYLIFEELPVNYRPVWIEGRLEASYPSSTTLLVLSVIPALTFQARRRLKNVRLNRAIRIGSAGFSLFMVVGRVLSGVHWITDIIGAILLSSGLFCIYRAIVIRYSKK